MRVAGEPCIWCGGMPCTDSGPAVCAPMDWALNGEGKAFQTFNAKGPVSLGVFRTRPMHSVAACWVQGKPERSDRSIELSYSRTWGGTLAIGWGVCLSAVEFGQTCGRFRPTHLVEFGQFGTAFDQNKDQTRAIVG